MASHLVGAAIREHRRFSFLRNPQSSTCEEAVVLCRSPPVGSAGILPRRHQTPSRRRGAKICAAKVLHSPSRYRFYCLPSERIRKKRPLPQIPLHPTPPQDCRNEFESVKRSNPPPSFTWFSRNIPRKHARLRLRAKWYCIATWAKTVPYTPLNTFPVRRS